MEGIEKLGLNRLLGLLLILGWVGILVGMLVASGKTAYSSHEYLHWFATFFRTGSVIFGGWGGWGGARSSSLPRSRPSCACWFATCFRTGSVISGGDEGGGGGTGLSHTA